MGRLSIGDALGTTFRATFRNLPALLATQGVVLLAALALCAVLGLTLGVGSAMLFAEGEAVLAWAVVAALSLGLFLAACIVVAALGVGTHAADAALRGERLRLADAWALTRPRAMNLLATALLGAAVALAASVPLFMAFGLIRPSSLDQVKWVVLAASLAVLALNLILFSRWTLAVPVATLEQRSPLGNYAEASALTAGSRAALLGALVPLLLGYGVLGVAVGLAFAEFPEAGLDLASPAFLLAAGLAVLAWVALALLTTFLWTTLVVVAYRRLALPAATDFEVLPEDEPSFVL